ncbi:MAG: glycosyl hydrolase family 8, partial [Cytophaga sp.]|uniref:glycosyl hydrolase family 8 n=1 Tax=Cytophaga sp. TaxID=29535 RepID=UPI003F7E0056
MLNIITKRGFYLLVFLLASFFTSGQVTVQINSGNPNFPFPQFLSYDFNGTHSLGNLATQNAPGVVHAEMEKIIREAWQIEANRYQYTGESWAGVNYILTNIGCPYDCSEGVGYALIAAAYMGDKKTFDGIWMREHDVRRVLQPSYRTGAIIRAGYQYGDNTIAEPGGDAATDGDVDIALGLLMAWKQWGDNSGYTAFNGSPISYKKEALDVIRGLVERKNRGFMSGSVPDCRSVSGEVGFDGYLKNGNTGPGETTTFGSGDPLWCPEFGGPNQLHIDYAAPSYFYSFRDVMTSESMDPWEINQMYRAEASSDWIMGKILNSPRGVPHAGWASVNGSTVTFSSFNLGEDFRAAWRTILNYVWHGDPTYTWDPVTHTVQSGVPNSFEQLVGKRFANFLTDQRKAPWGNACVDLGGGPDLTYTGPPVTSVQYDPNTGAVLYPLPINWGMATSAPSTIAAQDYDLMGDMFRQCAIEWDITAAGDRYLTSKPVYFHGFFRLLGMLILSGNFQDPLVAKPIANLKVYRAVDKTYGYTGDQFQFTLSYRNYGTVAATGTQLVETLPSDFDYVPGSASNGGIYDAGSRTITWNIGTVTGFSTAGGIAPTQGVRTYKLQANNNADGRYCNTATITAANSKSWTTNEYPNNVTEVMERNCIDIVKRALLIDKSVNYAKVQDNTEVKFKIDFENSSTAGWLNGGRPNVFFSYAQGTYGATGDTRGIKIRLFHGAAEPYINYKNYRISVFLNDNTYSCISGVGPCATGWALRNTIYEGGAATGVTFSQETITPGSDARGKWNQRVIIQFADQIATTTPQLSAQYGKPDRIHQGGTEPLRAVWDLYTSNYGAIDWSDDWSWDAAAADPDGNKYFPVTNDWTDPYNLNIPVTKWHKNACEVATKTVDNVLIEEWDGYTWRRAYGNGPLPGRDVTNVVIRDTLPLGLTFNGWVQQTTLGVTATYDPTTRVITWTIPKLQVGQKGSLEYKAIAKFTTTGVCPKADQKHINYSWIQGDNESKKADTASVTVTCDAVILPPPPTTMTKTADKTAYAVGDVINYTIAYTQTHGAIIDASMSTAADWNQYGGTWNFGTTLSNSTTNSTGTMAIHKKAHGTNGTITGSLQMAANASFSIAFRQTGTTIASGSYISFKANPGAGTIAVSVWNGATQVGATQTIGYPGAPQNFKIVLNGNQLNLWMGTLTGSPTLTVTGITVQAGYIGFLNGTPTGQDTYANHNIVSLHSEMDSAYDIIISDPIPAGVTFVSASNSGTNTAGTIAWPGIAGPVLYGTVITRTWSGTVASCAATGKIVNTAYANMLGQSTNSIAAQSVVNCAGTTSCTPPTTVTATVSKTDICLGAALSISGTASPANTNYYYTWFKDGVAITTPS